MSRSMGLPSLWDRDRDHMAAPAYFGRCGLVGGLVLVWSKCFLTTFSSCKKAEKDSAVFFSTQRLMDSLLAMDWKASKSSILPTRVDTLSKAITITLVSITSRSLTPDLKML